MCPTIDGSSTPSTTTHSPAILAVLDRLMAFENRDLLTARLDVSHAVMTAVGTAPLLLAQKPALVAFFGARADVVDLVLPLANAFQDAHVAYLALIGADLEPQFKALGDTRAQLVTLLQLAIERKVVTERVLQGLQGGNGYAERVEDVLFLVDVCRKAWPRLSAITKLTEADLDAAAAQARAFQTAVSVKEHTKNQLTQAGELRARAYTAFFNAWDQCRKMVTYLRWHEGDAELIAPSLFAGRGRARDAEDAPASDTSTSPVRPGMPGAPALSST